MKLFAGILGFLLISMPTLAAETIIFNDVAVTTHETKQSGSYVTAIFSVTNGRAVATTVTVSCSFYSNGKPTGAADNVVRAVPPGDEVVATVIASDMKADTAKCRPSNVRDAD